MQSLITRLSRFLDGQKSFVVLTGAGVSTGSGIPDYRDRHGNWKNAQPIQFGDFVRNEDYRKRYWARSFLGWRRFSAAQPNDAHRALATLEEQGRVDTLITQNVDRLHSEAGSRRVIDLHGNLGLVRCLVCGKSQTRRNFQRCLKDANPDWHAAVFHYRPDGDAELAEGSSSGFVVPDCRRCGGLLKPDVVMFGESVPKERVQQAGEAVARADALLVVGSSLMVYSGFRFTRQAHASRRTGDLEN